MPGRTVDRLKMIFISWISYSRRSELMAAKLGMRLYLISSLRRRAYLAPLRYVLQALRTLVILIRERPDVVFVQDPPLFAPLAVYLYARLWGARYVIDAHTTALLAPVWRWSMPLQGWLSRRAITTIVTNEHLAALVRSWGAEAFILADIPAQLPGGRPYPVNGEFSVVVINTFAPDEPVAVVLGAAAGLPDVQFYLTGDLRRARKDLLGQVPGNVKLTGFLPDEDYLGLLRASHAIMVLTTHDHTMQRGACEAVSLGKPVITSNWPLLRGYFHKGTVHVDNTLGGIQAGVRQMQRDRERLQLEMLELQHERSQEWRVKEAQLCKLLGVTDGRA